MLLDIGAVVIGLVGLLVGGEWLIRSASRLATALGVPTVVVGLTVVALGTSMPELVVSVSAALGGVSDVALGNVVGSNIANIGLIIGLAGLIAPLVLHVTLIRREIPIMIGASVVVLLMALDGTIGQADGIVLVLGYAVFTFVLYRFSRPASENAEVAEGVAEVEGQPVSISPVRELGVLVISIIVLIAGAQFIVGGAVNIARTVGISELVIGLTLVSVGTSLPEIATTLIAARRGHSDLAAGNAVGSNIANLLVILAVTSIIRPVPVPDQVLRLDLPIMIAFAVVIVPLAWNRRLERWQACVLLFGYAAFLTYVFIQG
jgi:cation:H+ antiporter